MLDSATASSPVISEIHEDSVRVQMPTDQACWRWENSTRFCRRDRIIKVAALIGSGAVALGSFTWSCVNLGAVINSANSRSDDDSFNDKLNSSGETLSFAGSIVGMVFSTAQSAFTIGYTIKRLDLTDYSDIDIARKIVADLENKSLAEIETEYGWRTRNLVKYGFMLYENKARFDELVSNHYNARKEVERQKKEFIKKQLYATSMNSSQLSSPLLNQSCYPLGEDPLQHLEAQWRTFVDESIKPHLPNLKDYNRIFYP